MQRRTVYSPLLVLVLLIEFSAIALLQPTPVSAAAKSWTCNSAGTYTWETAGCWSGGVLPAAGDTVTINPPADSITVVINSPVNISTIFVGSRASLAIAIEASLTLTGSASNFPGPLLINPGATVTLGGSAVVHVMNTLTVSGTLTIDAGGALNIYLVSGGSIVINSTAIVTVNGTLVNDADITNQGTLKGTGLIDINPNTLVNSGTVSPGSSPGILRIDGNYTQTSTGTLRIQIEGTTVGTQYSQLQVTGTATLNGSLSINVGDFTPSSSDSFNVGDFGIQVGDFTSENVENKPGTVIDQSTSTDVVIALDPKEYVYLPLTIR